MLVFQPAEELGQGAQAMIDDGLFDRFGRPDVVLGQHVAPLPAHSPFFAPVVVPTLSTGVSALVAAAHVWLPAGRS